MTYDSCGHFISLFEREHVCLHVCLCGVTDLTLGVKCVLTNEVVRLVLSI